MSDVIKLLYIRTFLGHLFGGTTSVARRNKYNRITLNMWPNDDEFEDILGNTFDFIKKYRLK